MQDVLSAAQILANYQKWSDNEEEEADGEEMKEEEEEKATIIDRGVAI